MIEIVEWHWPVRGQFPGDSGDGRAERRSSRGGGSAPGDADAFVGHERRGDDEKAGGRGTYVFLREAYGPERWDGVCPSCFVWQSWMQAPLCVGVSMVSRVSMRDICTLTPLNTRRRFSGGLVILIVIRCRRIATIGKNFRFAMDRRVGNHACWDLGRGHDFQRQAALISAGWPSICRGCGFRGWGRKWSAPVYRLLGYYNIGHIGAQIKDPDEYSTRHFSFSAGDRRGCIWDCRPASGKWGPWREAQKFDSFASLFVNDLYGRRRARFWDRNDFVVVDRCRFCISPCC